MKLRNLFMSLTLMLGMFTVAFKFNEKGVFWFWSENKPVGFILGITSTVTGLLWIKFQRKLNSEL